MKKIIAALMLAAVTVGPVVTAPAAEAGNTPGCVTRQEFGLVTTGKTLLWVEARFDTHGRLESQGYGYKTKSYRACYEDRWARFEVTYRHYRAAWRLEFKRYDSCYDCY
jgi:hypothetical protein